jgi:hypothetical protein
VIRQGRAGKRWPRGSGRGRRTRHQDGHGELREQEVARRGSAGPVAPALSACGCCFDGPPAVRHGPVQQPLGVLPRAPGGQTDHDAGQADPVRDAGPVTPQRARRDRCRDQRLDRLPQRVHHLGSTARMMFGTSTVSSLLVAPGMNTGTTRRPVDGHLSARPLKPRSTG